MEAYDTGVQGYGARKAGGGRGLSFTELELESFLDLLAEQSPIRNDEWEALKRTNQSRWPNANR